MPQENNDEVRIEIGEINQGQFRYQDFASVYESIYVSKPSKSFNFSSKNKNIQSDDELMGIENTQTKKLTRIETNLAVCISLQNYYSKYNTIGNGEYKSINSIVTFVKSVFDKKNNKNVDKTIGGVILGYLYKGKIYTNTSELHRMAPKLIDVDVLIYVTYCTGEKVGYITKANYLMVRAANSPSFELLTSSFNIKIESGTLSGKVWGLSSIKSEIEGAIFSKYKIEQGISKKIGETYYVEVNTSDILNSTKYPNVKSDVVLKYTLHDIRFVMPTLNGYNPPLDKTITAGSTVRSVDKKIGDIGLLKVMYVKPNNTSKRCSKNSSNRNLDVVLCRNTQGKEFKVYAKNLKLVNNVIEK